MVSVLYDMSLKRKNGFVAVGFVYRKKMVSLLYDLSLKSKNCFVAA